MIEYGSACTSCGSSIYRDGNVVYCEGNNPEGSFGNCGPLMWSDGRGWMLNTKPREVSYVVA